jgi:hypothetical protein
MTFIKISITDLSDQSTLEKNGIFLSVCEWIKDYLILNQWNIAQQ